MRSFFVVFASLLIASIQSKPFLKKGSTTSFSGGLTSFKESLSSVLNAGASKINPSIETGVEEVKDPQTTAAPVEKPVDVEIPEIEVETIDTNPGVIDIEKEDSYIYDQVIVDFHNDKFVTVKRKDIGIEEKEKVGREVDEEVAKDQENTITISKAIFADAINNFISTLFTAKSQIHKATTAKFVSKGTSYSETLETPGKETRSLLKARKSIQRNDAADRVIEEFTKEIQRKGSKKFIFDATDILEGVEDNVDEDYETDA
ncbi:unnamed protein product [Lepeophtheirus salmonis]|uniref:(salmon louse) hypothetical protein n=1 Tax=Lepeophtheirus salmonis TaxID=72036 RepID=A0A0K2U0M3_LEPSM|nr:unnamed protein product [Lepeophtheirus salmonis]CAF2780103.1 unnamed protein product [Lepeophtheirus salmonis]